MISLIMSAHISQVNSRFQFRKSQSEVKSRSFGSIQVVITIEGKEYPPLTVIKKIQKEVWENLHKQDRYISLELLPEVRSLRDTVHTFRLTIVEVYKKLIEKVANPTAIQIISRILGKGKKENPTTFQELYDRFIADATLRVVKDRNKRPVDKILLNYINSKGLRSTSLIEVDRRFVNMYENYLRQLTYQKVKNGPWYPYEQSYISKCAKFLKQIIAYAYDHSFIDHNRLENMRFSSGDIKEPYNIPEEDIIKIENYQEYSDYQKKIVFGWLLSRELALHFVDYCDLEEAHFRQIGDRHWYFEKPRCKLTVVKTKQKCILSERATRMLDFFEKNPLTMPFNKKEEQGFHFKSYLKPALQMALGTEVNYVFSHARDSMIYQLLRKGASPVEIMTHVGWSTLRELPRYARIDERILLERQFEYSNRA